MKIEPVEIKPCESAVHPGWLRLRQALWPEGAREQHLEEMAALVAAPQRYRQFLAYSPSSEAVGLIEASMRGDYVNGTETSPATVCDWARRAGCREIASDAVLENSISHVVHRALGFEETERVVFFRRKLA